MAGKRSVLRSSEPGVPRASRPGRTASGEVLSGAVAERAAGRLAAGVAPRHSAFGTETHEAAVLVAAGLVAMAAGLLVYLTDRDPSRAALIPAIAALAGGNLFGALGQWMPSFVHPFAFALFTATTYPARTSAGYLACGAWWAVNVAFEVAQHPAISGAVARAAEGVFGRPWPARLLSNYVLRGTFDVGDLIASTAGAVAAAAVLYLVHRREVSHER